MIQNRKCYSRLLMRYEMAEGSSIMVEISYDGGPWQTVKNVYAAKHRTAVLPLRPNRCDSFQIRVSGEGPAVLRALTRQVHLGGLG